MTQVRISAHLDAPIDRVFELATDFKRYPEWNVNYVEVLQVLGPTSHLGTRIEATMKLLDRKLEGWSEIVEIDQPRRLSQRDAGQRPGLTTSEREELKRLQRENVELKRANEILRKASAFFAQAELDRRLKS